ncbi:bifunctional adenosylcobinamide kinase/adenosylcobinamide-phosphate guanylyltransferase [Romeria aff. gracilis LEGE 07310]|uniref:Adenosylcobinamide kinase n=1 Tax=Vasconcelosia minhoensis LEGE 07310 TaxID=915328 RepID=A0A8J7A926_9CYAN|nr:bifunctional adenosylcobinamide kinase/adenosylcobinamide-phosphate guanylyltransferase [Romeria gracilis]MBE9076271.1 bifunctional adenosylcobinamide kinase/adenosylcobinamide-phosphate guanylyltransferase [Romeria aff. gracilis LEGE 07310]
MSVTLITGPARSGKSEWAEHLAAQAAAGVIYVATAQNDPSDREWQQRIEQHRQRRPKHWQVREVPVDLTGVLRQADSERCLLIDSLGTWLANLLDQDEATWQCTQTELLAALEEFQAEVILVAEETGWGLVPAYPAGRVFRDRLGRLTRRVGAIAASVYLVSGGYALDLKRLGRVVPGDG